MKKINLGNSGLMASEIALGCMRINGMEVNDLEAYVHTALECGVDFFDHADIYGGGESEAVFGKLLKQSPEVREQMVLQSKCGIRPGRYDFSKEHILESVDGSLKRLQTDHLDVLLLHRPDALMEPDEVAEAFTALESSGKVRYFGVSNFNSRQLELLQSSLKQKILVNQLQLSIMHTGMIDHALRTNTDFCHAEDRDGEILDYCRLKGITIQAWSPFQYGFFEGVFVDNEKFPELNKTLAELSEKYGISKTALCVAWIQRHPARIQTIVGTTNPKRLQDICTAGNVRLSREDWYKIYLSAGNELP